MDPSRMSTDRSAPSSSSKPRRVGMFRAMCDRLLEPDGGSESGLFTCFQFLRNRGDTEEIEYKVTLPSQDSLEFQRQQPPSPRKEKGDVLICVKCKMIFLSDHAASEDNLLCSTCNKKPEDDGSDESLYEDAYEEETEIRTSTNEEIFKYPIQCISCKRIHRTSLKEFLTDDELFKYECLDCNLKQVIRSKKPASAFNLASSIVEKEITNIKNRMWDSMCEINSGSPVYSDGTDWKCSATLCKGASRYRVQCNLCAEKFHTRCVSLPDYNFQYFRCNSCRKEKRNKGASASSSSLEQRALLRRPERRTLPKYNPPEPVLCYICKNRVICNFDYIPRKTEPSRLRCLSCIHGRELMV